MAKYSIAVLGAGNVGGGLARVWVAAGHGVTFGLPKPTTTGEENRMSTDVKMARKAIHDKLESQIKTAEAKLDTLKARAETAKANVELRAITELLTRKQAILQKLHELKLCVVVATPVADFKNTRKATDVEHDGTTPVARPGREFHPAVRVPDLRRPCAATQNSRKEN